MYQKTFIYLNVIFIFINHKFKKSTKSLWFDGSNQINCNIKKINDSLKNIGELFVDITKLMPGIKVSKLVDQGANFVIIKTNEGFMKRKNISIKIHASMIVLEFDEVYQAGKSITTKSHHLEKYTVNGSKVDHDLIISDVQASGFLGFFYRIFGKKSIGSAILNSYKTFFEK